MSGGRFDYRQSYIFEIAQQIDHIVETNNFKCKEYPKCRETWQDCDCGYEFSDEVINEFKNAVITLKKAYIYAQRVDWLLSGDDSEENFLFRLKKDFNKLEDM